jgi:hypothetical protein
MDHYDSMFGSDLKRRPFRVNGPAKEVYASADGVRPGAMGYGMNRHDGIAPISQGLLRIKLVISYAALVSDVYNRNGEGQRLPVRASLSTNAIS